MHGERRPTCNAVPNNQYTANKIVINNLYALSLYDYFLLVCRFLTFFRILRSDVASTIDAGFEANRTLFMQPLLADCTFYPVPFLFCYTAVFYTLFAAVTVVRIIRVRFWTISLKLFFISLVFCFFLWVAGELVRTFPRRLLSILDGSEFNNFGGGDNFMKNSVGIYSWETWMCVDGWTDTGVKACHFNWLFHQWHGKSKMYFSR
jgi:hypothetical protein